MIAIKVNNRFLDIKPGTNAEVTRRSPFFGIEEVMIEYSTAMSFLFTENNAIALGYLYQYYTYRKKKKLTVELFDDNIFKARCTLIIEAGTMDLNNIERSEMSGYLLFGVSDFYNAIKDKKLTDLTMGGLRHFDYTTNSPYDNSGGYWQHFHDTWTNASIPYVFAPVRNEGYYGTTADADWMNKLGNDGALAYDFINPIVPMIKVKYLLEQIFIEFGFKVDFSGLNDTQWEKMLLGSLVRVEWNIANATLGPDGNPVYTGTPKAFIDINLAKHLPNKTIGEFIINLFYKYGWAPVFDSSRTVRMVSVKSIGSGSIKDWTEFAAPTMGTQFSDDPKIYSFSNDVDSNDSNPVSYDITGLKLLLPAYTIRYVPAPQGYMEGRVMYCFFENAYYQAVKDDNGPGYLWQLYGDNIYKTEPPGFTDNINSSISTLPVVFSEYRIAGGITYYGVFPIMKQQFETPFGFRTLIYHGMRYELNENGGQGAILIPHASSLVMDPLGTTLLTWSNVYDHKIFPNTPFEVDYGIVKYWWGRFQNVLKYGETVEDRLYLPRHILVNFRWDDEVLIGGISYLVKSLIEPIPYTGFVQATLKRIVVNEERVIAIAGPTIYARLTIENISIAFEIPSLNVIFYKCDVRVSLYSDAAGTIPYTPLTPLYVFINQINTESGVATGSFLDSYPVSSASEVVRPNVGQRSTQNGNTINSFSYTLVPEPNGTYIVI